MVGVDSLQVLLSQVDLEADGLSAPVGPQDPTTAPDLRGPVEISVRNPLAYVDAEVDGLHGLAEFDGDGGEVRPDLDRSTRDREGALVCVVLALIVLNASRDQDRDRRVRAAAPASAA